jgi:hypothetical protein
MPQIVKPEISNASQVQHRLETPFHPLPFTLDTTLRRKNAVLSNHRRAISTINCSL